jgi:hypothetical protein
VYIDVVYGGIDKFVWVKFRVKVKRVLYLHHKQNNIYNNPK